MEVDQEIEDGAGNEGRCQEHELDGVLDVRENVEGFSEHFCGGVRGFAKVKSRMV